ncbi:uncharacterized protein LOC106654452 [Trichogramma pretiosum]|uniref:uncharacterized protein LOC106654452 n=1 Tax=Trichogramma pretiosum TaxID=7493 RepID=UPI0006C99305|nr:uncharacterized protein LOC106654452 [Trichogramma pretiosum]
MGCTRSKLKNAPVSLPLLSAHSRQEWIAWRRYFFTHIHDKDVPIYRQSEEFFRLIGEVGYSIMKNLYFGSISDERNLEILLHKFDVYFTFCGKRKRPDETLDNYFKSLESIAEKTANSRANVDKYIKEKLLQDMKHGKIFEQFLKIVPIFSKVSNYETLTSTELKFIWYECEYHEDIRKSCQLIEKLEPVKEVSIYQKEIQPMRKKNICFKCGHDHSGRRCPAWGQRCWKCGDLNHFLRCCPKTFIRDCVNCGRNHIQFKCPAYAKECSRCKKNNHFAWQCLGDVINCCDYCGQSHLSGRNNCPAAKNICNKCQKIGHFTSKCRSRRNSLRK